MRQDNSFIPSHSSLLEKSKVTLQSSDPKEPSISLQTTVHLHLLEPLPKGATTGHRSLDPPDISLLDQTVWTLNAQTVLPYLQPSTSCLDTTLASDCLRAYKTLC